MSVRTSAAIALGRLTSWGLRKAGRSASQLPGRVALALDSQVIAALAQKLTRGSIVVCGTNGKTTTNNIVASAVEQAGNTVLCNRIGANMAPGIAAAMLPGAHADWAILEADELSTIHILPQLKPTYLVLLNLFRDQLDRAGEIDHVQDVIVSALQASPTTTLLCCGDDPFSVAVAERAAASGTRVMSFGLGEDLGQVSDRVPEARFCPVCGSELIYEYRSYAQLGAFYCPKGDFARPTLDFVARDVVVDRTGVAFSFVSQQHHSTQPEHLHASFGGAYMVYNLLAACAAAQLAGVDVSSFQRAVDGFKPDNGRLQHFVVEGREVILNLAKNPTGFNQNISLLLADKRPKALHIAVNDKVNDGKDISWIWDVDFERFVGDDQPLHIFCSGTRANDLQVRLKYAGIPATLSKTVGESLDALKREADLTDTSAVRASSTSVAAPSYTDEVQQASSKKIPLYVLTNYSALWPAKAELEAME